MAETISIKEIILLAPPFSIGEIVDDEVLPTPETSIEEELVLETPTLLVSGLRVVNGKVSRYNSKAIQVDILEESNRVFRNKQILTFLGDISISFSSIYPIKTYSKEFKTNNFIGEPVFNYQFNRAEIRYNIVGRSPDRKGKTYKGNIVLKQNTTGSDNIIFNYKLYYKGKVSETAQIEFNIIKQGSGFYKH